MKSLLAYLDALSAPYAAHIWRGWQITPIASGNNRLFRVAGTDSDLAVKFCIRDARDRATREFSALTLLQHAGVQVAPTPVLLDSSSYGLPVIVCTWLQGQTFEALSASDAAWSTLVDAQFAINQIPAQAAERAGLPAHAATTAAAQRERIHAFAQDIPAGEQPAELRGLLERLNHAALPALETGACLCHGDANLRNFLKTPNGVALVDWEYARIDDPAAHFATLLTHPVAQHLPETHWQQLRDRYALLSGDELMRKRIDAQRAFGLIWWAIRLVYGKTVLLRRPSTRLAGHGPEAEISTDANIAAYIERAHRQLGALTATE